MRVGQLAEVGKDVLLVSLIMLGNIFGQIIIAYIAALVIFPPLCALVVKKAKIPYQVSDEFIECLEWYSLDRYILRLRRRMRVGRILVLMLIRLVPYLVWVVFFTFGLVASLLQGSLLGLVLAVSSVVPHYLAIYFTLKILRQLWRMSKTTPST